MGAIPVMAAPLVIAGWFHAVQQDAVAPSGSAPAAAPAPLFAGHEVLPLRIAVDLRRLLRDRGDDRQEHPGTPSYRTDTGGVTLPVEIRTRGHFRLRRSTCAFPPLRLDFPSRETAGTLFEGQDKLKLVTHCQSRGAYEQYLLQEYLIYRVFTLLTERSYRARLVRVTYVDTSAREDSLTRYAILLESDGALAARTGTVLVEPGVPQELTDPDHMTLVAVFQYFVGNTDWSVAALHNVTLLRDTARGEYYAVPYDFDWSGVISAPYAVPAPVIGTRTVRERVYRGFCPAEVTLAPVLARFQVLKDSIYALYRAQEGLEDGQRRQALEYYDEFYAVLSDPRRARREFSRNCR